MTGKFVEIKNDCLFEKNRWSGTNIRYINCLVQAGITKIHHKISLKLRPF